MRALSVARALLAAADPRRAAGRAPGALAPDSLRGAPAVAPPPAARPRAAGRGPPPGTGSARRRARPPLGGRRSASAWPDRWDPTTESVIPAHRAGHQEDHPWIATGACRPSPCPPSPPRASPAPPRAPRPRTRGTTTPRRSRCASPPWPARRPCRCGTPITGLGTTATTAQLQDLRFYVSNVRLTRRNDTSVPLTLTGRTDYNLTAGGNRIDPDRPRERQGLLHRGRHGHQRRDHGHGPRGRLRRGEDVRRACPSPSTTPTSRRRRRRSTSRP